jgi:FeS assembly SUF system protein
MDDTPTKSDELTIATPADVEAAASGAAAPAPSTLAASPAVQPPSPDSDDPLLRDIVAALKTVYDPEIPADVYELGLIYTVDVDDDRNVAIAMTLTAPGCPVAGEMPKWVENAVNAVPGVASTSVTMTFDPPWDMSRMSDEARLALNMF